MNATTTQPQSAYPVLSPSTLTFLRMNHWKDLPYPERGTDFELWASVDSAWSALSPPSPSEKFLLTFQDLVQMLLSPWNTPTAEASTVARTKSWLFTPRCVCPHPDRLRVGAGKGKGCVYHFNFVSFEPRRVAGISWLLSKNYWNNKPRKQVNHALLTLPEAPKSVPDPHPLGPLLHIHFSQYWCELCAYARVHITAAL